MVRHALYNLPCCPPKANIYTPTYCNPNLNIGYNDTSLPTEAHNNAHNHNYQSLILNP